MWALTYVRSALFPSWVVNLVLQNMGRLEFWSFSCESSFRLLYCIFRVSPARRWRILASTWSPKDPIQEKVLFLLMVKPTTAEPAGSYVQYFSRIIRMCTFITISTTLTLSVAHTQKVVLSTYDRLRSRFSFPFVLQVSIQVRNAAWNLTPLGRMLLTWD